MYLLKRGQLNQYATGRRPDKKPEKYQADDSAEDETV